MSDFLKMLSRFSPFSTEDGAQTTPKTDRVGAAEQAREQSLDAFLAGPVQPPKPAVTTAKTDRLQPQLAPTQKLANDLDQIQAALDNPDTQALLTVSRQRENGFGSDNEILNDWEKLDSLTFRRKYGEQIFQKVTAYTVGGLHVNRLANAQRDFGQIADDSVVAGASGLVQGVGGLAATALQTMPGPVNEFLGTKLAEGLGSLAESGQERQSDDLNRRRYVDSLRAELDTQDNEAQLEEEKLKGNDFVASLRSIGRGIVSGAERLAEDPAMLGNLTAEGIGSLAVGGPASKSISAGGRLANDMISRASRMVAPTVDDVGSRALQKALDAASFPTAIGAMEAGSVYNQGVQETLNTSFEDLAAQSPEFNQMVESGMAPEDARRELAHQRGVIGGALTAPVAAVAGRLVAPFEKAPLSGVTKMPANTVKETVEEGVQSGMGELADNAAAQISGVDPQANLAAGVGDATVQGGLAGTGTAVTLQTPGLTLKATAKAAGIVIDKTIGSLIRSGEQILDNAKKESSVSAEKLAPVVQEAAEQAPAIADGLRKLAEENKAKDAEVYIQKIQSAAELQNEDMDMLSNPLGMQLVEQRRQLGRMPNRLEATVAMAMATEDENLSETDRQTAALFVAKQIDNLTKTFSEDYPAFLENVSHDRPEYEQFEAYANVLTQIGQEPTVRKAIQWAQQEMRQGDQELSSATITTPEGQQIVRNTIDAAILVPHAANPKVAEQILQLYQADSKALTLTAEERRILRGQLALHKAGKLYEASMRVAEPGMMDRVLDELEQELQETKAKDEILDFIGRQIEIEGGAKGHQKSLTQYTAEINKAVSAGKLQDAKVLARRLGAFARSHANKVAAANQSIRAGDGRNVPYQAFNGEKFFENTKGWGVNVGSAGSEKAVRKIHAEALAIAELANQFRSIYPAFNMQEVKVPDLLLDQEIVRTQDTKRGSSKPSASTNQSGATTPQTVDVRQEAELPPPPSQQTRATDVKVSAEETKPAATTDQTESSSSEVVEEPAPSAEPDVSQPEKTAEVSPEITEDNPAENTDNLSVADTEIIEFIDNLDENGSTELTTKDAFPNLVQVKDRNWFHRAFRFSSSTTSRLSRLENPLADVWQLLGKPAREILSFLDGQDVPYDVTTDDRQAMRTLLDMGRDALKIMNGRLKNALLEEKEIKKGLNKGQKRKSLIQSLKDGEEWALRSRDTQILNILDQADGKIGYNPQLIQSAVLAGLDWVLNATDRIGKLDAEDVAKILGVAASEADAYKDAFNRGLSLDMAVQSLSENIRKFWGVSADNNAPENYTKGIPEAVAKEVLKALEELQLLKLGSIEVAHDHREYLRVWFDERPDNLNEFMKQLGDVSELIADLALVDREKEGYSIGEPIREVDQEQLRNRQVKTTRQQKRALENVQKTPYLPNTMVFDFIQAMGQEAFVTLFSGHPYAKGDLKKDHKKAGLNKAHWRSVQGLQRSLVNSFDNVTKQMNQIRKHTQKARIPVEQVQTFYKFHINKLGRLQMAGLSNPQADKLAREIFMSTRSVLDLSQPGNDDFRKFYATLAQGIGEKTESLSYEKITEAVENRIFGKDAEFRPLVESLKIWLDNRDNGGSNELSASTLEQLAQAKLSMHGLHSLLAVAGYELARDRGLPLNQFEVFNYLEADGKTNGPINSLMLAASGMFDATWLKMVAKGGAFFGKLNKTLDQHADKKDLYKEAAELTQKKTEELEAQLREENPAVHEQFEAFRRVLNELNADVELDPSNGTLTINRGVTKNPLTITVYGSGADGIAGKITKELIDTINEQLSESVAAGNEAVVFNADFNRMITHRPGKNKKEEFYLASTGLGAPSVNTQDFEMSPQQFKALQDNVRLFLVDPMVGAIDETVNRHVLATTTTVQKATQIQSIILKAMFVQEITTLLAEKKARGEDYSAGEFLSRSELDNIMKKLEVFSPIIETGRQSYMLSGGETSNLFEKMDITLPTGETVSVSLPDGYSRALTGDLRTPAYVYGPTLAGVRATPTLVVGSGDGQMMLNGMADKPALASRTLPTFDGLQMPADAIETFSKDINESVLKTWAADPNPIRAVAESFAAFSRANPIEVLFPNNGVTNEAQILALKEIQQTKNNAPKLEDAIPVGEAQSFINGLVDQLENLASDIDIRRQVVSEMPFSVDQMASAKSPFVNQGSIPVDPEANEQDIADAMNARYAELKAEQLQKKQERAAVERENAAINQVITKLAQADATGARVFEAHQLPSLFKHLSDILSPVQKEMMRNAVKLLEGSEYRIVFGTTRELNNWEQANNPERFVPDTTDVYGKTDPISKIIYVGNISGETIVHELIHAATFNKVHAFYSNSSKLSKVDFDAISRIELMMQEWLTLDYDRNSDIAMSRRMAERAINEHLKKKNSAAALNEFMAWVLSNQNLAETAQKTKIQHPLIRIVTDVLKVIRNLIWGGENKGPKLGDSMLSNLRFNTRILMATPSRLENLKSDWRAVVLHQSASFGSNTRLTDLREVFERKIVNWLKDFSNPVDEQRRERIQRRSEIAADELTTIFAAHFPELGNMQAFSTFQAIQKALMVEADLNANSLSRLEELYAHVNDQLEVSHFRENDDPQDQNDLYQAQAKFDVLQGLYGTRTDAFGRSSLMSSFLALALVDEGFRKILSRMDKPKDEQDKSGTLDALLDNTANKALGRLSLLLSGERNGDRNVRDALDALTLSMLADVGDQRSHIEQRGENGLTGLDKRIADAIQDGSERAVQTGRRLRQSSNPAVKAAGALPLFVGTMINERRANEAALGMISWFNKKGGLESVRALINDVVGRTRENALVFDMISKVRQQVQQTRQNLLEELPVKLAKAFSRKVTADEWTAMFKSLGKTDLAALTRSYGVEGALDLVVNDQRLQSEIQNLESNLDPRFHAKAKQLAHYMLTGEQGVMLLRNAYAIAALTVPGVRNMTPDPAMVEELDRLVSLYAIQDLDQTSREAMAELLDSEQDGVSFVTNYLVGQRVDELAKVNAAGATARLNHYKGHIPSEAQGGGSLIIASDTEHDRLVLRGYVRTGSYEGSSADRSLGSRSYYFAPVSGLAPYSQGVLQTVHQTASGIDPQTGYTMGEVMAGRIEDPRLIQLTKMQIANQRQTRENLLPVYDDGGNIVAFERAADVQKLSSLKRSTDLAKMIGVWHGRQMEEMLAQEVNKELVGNLYQIWQEGVREGRRGEFVNIARLGRDADPILREAARLIPNQMRDEIKSVFGPDEFWVRKDMLLDTFGARQASVGDLFTGQTRWKPQVAENFEKIAYGIFGITGKEREAYQRLVQGEKFLQEVVANVKQLIVVKSVIVPVANVMSNMLHLLNRGVPLRDVIKGMGAKTAEINAYVKRRRQEVDLEADLRAARGRNDIVAVRKIENKIQSIQDSYRRMSIWPLIEAGEFSAISNGTPTTEDLALADGKWTQWVEKKVSELPDGLRTIARYGLITRDTSLYQGLARSVQYGDFIAKAILYDDLTKRKKLGKKEAVVTVNETFVNYNRLAGRGRQYLESVGLLWFYNFKLRAMKEAAWTLRHNPLRSLLMTAVPAVPVIGNIGTPVSDNFLTVLGDGRLGYSIGPSMGLNSWNLNPWVSLVR